MARPRFHITRQAASAAADVIMPIAKCVWSWMWRSHGAMATRALTNAESTVFIEASQVRRASAIRPEDESGTAHVAEEPARAASAARKAATLSGALYVVYGH